MSHSEHNKLHFEQARDKYLANLEHNSNEKHWNCKLTDKDIEDIRTKHMAGVSIKELAEIYGVSESHTGAILRGVYRKVK